MLYTMGNCYQNYKFLSIIWLIKDWADKFVQFSNSWVFDRDVCYKIECNIDSIRNMLFLKKWTPSQLCISYAILWIKSEDWTHCCKKWLPQMMKILWSHQHGQGLHTLTPVKVWGAQFYTIFHLLFPETFLKNYHPLKRAIIFHKYPRAFIKIYYPLQRWTIN